MEKLRMLKPGSKFEGSIIHTSSLKLFPTIESRVYFLLTILSNWPWIITSQFKLINAYARARAVDIIFLLIKWSRECGHVYNHVVKVIYLSTPGLWKEYLSRFVDIDAEIRSKCIEMAKTLLKTRNVAPLVCDLQIKLGNTLLYDPDPMIRMESLEACLDVAAIWIERICNPYLLKALASRIGDKEAAIRIDAIKVIGVCFKAMLLINNPKVIKVQHVFKMASAVFWLYKDRQDYKLNDERRSRKKLAPGNTLVSEKSPIDLPDSDANVNLDPDAIYDEDTNHGDANHGDANHGDANHGDANQGDANKSVDYNFTLTEYEKYVIESTVSDQLIDALNEDAQVKSGNILILIAYCDNKALESFANMMLTQCKLRKETLRLLSSTRADEEFYASLNYITEKFDYLEDAKESLNSVLLDLRNNQELIVQLEEFFNCSLSLKDAVQVANDFVTLESSQASDSSSGASEKLSGKKTLKEHLMKRSGAFFMDKETLLEILYQMKSFDTNLSVRMASFLLLASLCFSRLFLDQEIFDAIMKLNPRIHLVMTHAHGIKLDHLPSELKRRMGASADRFIRRKLSVTRLTDSSSSFASGRESGYQRSEGQRSADSLVGQRSADSLVGQRSADSLVGQRSARSQDSSVCQKRVSSGEDPESPTAKIPKSGSSKSLSPTSEKSMRIEKSFLSESSSSNKSLTETMNRLSVHDGTMADIADDIADRADDIEDVAEDIGQDIAEDIGYVTSQDETLREETLQDETLQDETLQEETLQDETLQEETLREETLEKSILSESSSEKSK